MIKVLLAIPETYGELVKRRFERENFDTELVADGRMLLERLGQSRFDVVMFPYIMMYLNGLEVLDLITKMDLKNRPILIMTSHIHTSQLILNAYHLGLHKFYPAPVDIEKIVNYILYETNNTILDSDISRVGE